MRALLSRFRSQAVSALLAVLTTSLMTLILELLRGYLNAPVIGLLFLLPVLLSTTLWGLRAGIIASVFAFLSFNYFFIPPYYTFNIHQTQDLIALLIFLSIAILISQLVGRIQSSLAQAQAHEHEIAQLYDLSTILVSLRREEEVARRLASDLVVILSCEAIQVIVTPEYTTQPLIVTYPGGAFLQDRQPDAAFPLATQRGKLGEIRVWMSGAALTASRERVVRAFAGQGALALERAILEQMEARASILEESDRMKSALLSSVSHELRTPLVTIKAAATSLRSGEVRWDSPARDDLLAALEEEVDRLNALVGDLLNMSRIEAGALKLQQQWNILAEIADAAVVRLKPRIKNNPLEVDISEDLPLVWVDQTLIQQVFVNLIDNSAKYSPPGSPIGVSARASDGSGLVVEITNQGPPVPDEHLETIFERFHRVTDAERVPGTGLGLSICKSIIEAHGEHIRAENRPTGFAFQFTLPTTHEGSPPSKPQPGDE